MSVPLATSAPSPSNSQLFTTLHTVPVTPGLGDDLVLQEERSGRSEETKIPREGGGVNHVLCLRLRDLLLLLLSFLVVRQLPQGRGEGTGDLTRSEQLCVAYGGGSATETDG